MNCYFFNFGGAYLGKCRRPNKMKGVLNSSYHRECFHKKIKRIWVLTVNCTFSDSRDVIQEWTLQFSRVVIRRETSQLDDTYTFSEHVDRGAKASQLSWHIRETWPSKFARQIFGRQDSLCPVDCYSVRSHLVNTCPVPFNNVIVRQGRTLTYQNEVKKPRDNLIVRPSRTINLSRGFCLNLTWLHVRL
jgi:hypothetical protein